MHSNPTSGQPALSQSQTRSDSPAEGALQALEISYLMTNSRTLWLYSADRLLLAFTLFIAAFCVYTSNPAVKKLASRCHATFGVLLALACCVGFAFDVVRFVDWSIAAIGLGITTLVIDMVLLPIWLLWLACVLRRVSLEGGSYATTTSVEMTDKHAAPAGDGV